MISYGALKLVFKIFKDHNVAFFRPNDIVLLDTDKVRLVNLFMEDDTICVFIDLA